MDNAAARHILAFSAAGLVLLSAISSLVAWHFGNPPEWTGIPVWVGVKAHAPFQFEFWRSQIDDRYQWICGFARLGSLATILLLAVRCSVEIHRERAARIDDFGADRWANVRDLKRKDLL